MQHWTQKLCQTFKETLETSEWNNFYHDIESYDEHQQDKKYTLKAFCSGRKNSFHLRYIQHTHTHTEQRKRWLSIYTHFASSLQVLFHLAFCYAVQWLFSLLVILHRRAANNKCSVNNKNCFQFPSSTVSFMHTAQCKCDCSMSTVLVNSVSLKHKHNTLFVYCMLMRSFDAQFLRFLWFYV